MDPDSSAGSPALKIAGVFARFPQRAKVAAIAAVALIVVGAVAIPIAASAVEQRDRRHAAEIAAEEAAAGLKADAEAAKVLAEARETAAAVNAGFAGFTVSLAAAVSAEAAAAFEDARVELAHAIANGGVDELAAATDAVTDALGALVTSAGTQADALIGASPLADQQSKDALIAAVADLAGADDVMAALTRVKAASDAVVAAQAAGTAAAAAAEQEAAGSSGGAAAPGGGSGSGVGAGGGASGSGEYPPGIIEMTPVQSEHCGEFSAGQVITLQFHWEARAGNAVDIYYALTDSPTLASSGYMQIAAGAASSGSVSIPRTCPTTPGPLPFVSVRAVASNSQGSATSNYWGL